MVHKYIGVKIISAQKMTRGAYNDNRGWKLPEDENYYDDGYFVKYSEDPMDEKAYISWSPKDVFEEAYRTTEGLPFGIAVEGMKKGKRAARMRWTGRRGSIVLQPGYDAIEPNANMKKLWKIDKVSKVQINPWFQIEDVNGSFSVWTPSTADILADDWMLLD